MSACRHKMFTDEDGTRCLFCGRGAHQPVLAFPELVKVMDRNRGLEPHEALALLARIQAEQESVA